MSATKESLRKRTADSEQVRWIPVSERLPDRYETVFVTNGLAIDTVHRFMRKGVSEWAGTMNVTHWMPIPPPPQEQG